MSDDAGIIAAADQVAAAGRQALNEMMPAARAVVDRVGAGPAIAWMASELITTWHPVDVAGMLAAALGRLVELERSQQP